MHIFPGTLPQLPDACFLQNVFFVFLAHILHTLKKPTSLNSPTTKNTLLHKVHKVCKSVHKVCTKCAQSVHMGAIFTSTPRRVFFTKRVFCVFSTHCKNPHFPQLPDDQKHTLCTKCTKCTHFVYTLCTLVFTQHDKVGENPVFGGRLRPSILHVLRQKMVQNPVPQYGTYPLFAQI